jgi:hypothetical protein
MVCAHRCYSIYRVCKLSTNLTEFPLLFSLNTQVPTLKANPYSLSPTTNKVRRRVLLYCISNICWSVTFDGVLHLRAQQVMSPGIAHLVQRV